jgi:hypothetical protein
MPFLPFIPFLDCADLVIHFTQQTSLWLLTMGFKYAGPVGVPELTTLTGAIDLWISGFLAAQIESTTTIDFIKATGLTTAADPVITVPASTPAGTLVGNVLTAQAAMCVTFHTANRGRSYRGRNFVAARVHGDLQTVTTWTAVRQAAIQNAYNNLPGIVAPTGWTQCILSRQNNSVRRLVGVATPVLAYEAKVQVATQRKRLL